MSNVQMVTPNGIASYPHLSTPDTYQGKDEYNCKLILDPSIPAVQEFKESLEKQLEATTVVYLQGLKDKLSKLDPDAQAPKFKKDYAETKALVERLQARDVRNPLVEEYDKEGLATGKLVFTCKSKSSFKKKDGTVVDLQPKFHDASGAVMAGRPLISGGAEIALSITVLPYCMSAAIGSGLTARINGVQIISLGGGGAGGGGGFAKQEGYVDDGLDASAQSLATPEDAQEDGAY